MTDTDSTLVLFIFIRHLGCSLDERKSRDIIFKVMIKSKILDRLDLSDDFFGINLEFKIKVKKTSSTF